MERTIRVKGKVRYCDNYVDNRINQKNQRIVRSLVFVYINNKCAIGATIKSEIIVRSINMTNNSNKFTGIDDARISPPTSDR